jgi:hypothetical protein
MSSPSGFGNTAIPHGFKKHKTLSDDDTKGSQVLPVAQSLVDSNCLYDYS